MRSTSVPVAILLSLIFVFPVVAGEMGRDLYLPIVGRAVGAGGMQYRTRLWLMNPTDHRVDVAVTFLRAASTEQPQSISVRLPPVSVVTQELEESLLGTGNQVGALRVRAKHDIAATARLYSFAADNAPGEIVGSSMDAMASEHAIGTGQQTLLGGNPGTRYKLYAVETGGAPLQLSVRLLNASGQALATRRFYLEPRVSQAWDLSAMMPAGRDASWVEVSGVNGSGKALVGGESLIEGNRDSTLFTMTTVTSRRFAIGGAEVAEMNAAALALIVVALARRA
jgi:hypothetical protein